MGPDASLPFPAVPGDDFATFRAAARRLLDPNSFRRVDAVWRAALAQTLAWPPLARTSLALIESFGCSASQGD